MQRVTGSMKLIHYYRHPGLTCAAEENLLRKLQNALGDSIESITTEICYNLDMICDFTEEERNVGSNRSSLLLTLRRS